MRAVLKQFNHGEASLVHANVKTGSDDAWRAHASAALQQRMWDAIPPDIATLLSLDR
jgi:hypothetical protein